MQGLRRPGPSRGPCSLKVACPSVTQKSCCYRVLALEPKGREAERLPFGLGTHLCSWALRSSPRSQDGQEAGGAGRGGGLMNSQ